MNLVFRDHTHFGPDRVRLFAECRRRTPRENLITTSKAAQPVLDSGPDAVVPIILDGENAWEYYPQSGREFLRRFYDALQKDPEMEAVTVSEAIERHKTSSRLQVAGSGIMDQRKFQRLDRSSRGQQGLGLPLSCAQFLRASVATAPAKHNANWRMRKY